MFKENYNRNWRVLNSLINISYLLNLVIFCKYRYKCWKSLIIARLFFLLSNITFTTNFRWQTNANSNLNLLLKLLICPSLNAIGFGGLCLKTFTCHINHLKIFYLTKILIEALRKLKTKRKNTSSVDVMEYRDKETTNPVRNCLHYTVQLETRQLLNGICLA